MKKAIEPEKRNQWLFCVEMIQVTLEIPFLFIIRKFIAIITMLSIFRLIRS